MIDPDRLETARAVLIHLFSNKAVMEDAVAKANQLATTASNLIAQVAVQFSDDLIEVLERTQKETTGHPAETALEQCLTLLAELKDEPLSRVPKWLKATAKAREMKELCAYLGAEIE